MMVVRDGGRDGEQNDGTYPDADEHRARNEERESSTKFVFEDEDENDSPELDEPVSYGLRNDAAPGIYTFRWRARLYGKEVIVYAPSQDEATTIACSYFGVPRLEDQIFHRVQPHIEQAGHVEWVTLDEGLPTERVAQRTVWPNDEVFGVTIDNRKAPGS
jgi:hypothetical protein